MLSGDNSILQRATDAKTKSDEAQIKERIQLAYHSALTGGQGSYTKNTLMDELKNEFETDYDVDDSDDTNWKMMAHGQEITIPAGEIDLSVDTTWQKAFESPGYNRYILDEVNKTLTLLHGHGVTSENIEIKKYAIINYTKYETKFPNSLRSFFAGETNIKSIKIDSDINTSNVTDMYGMFANCNSLKTLEMSHFNTSNVTNMGSLFSSCSSLVDLDLSGWNTSKVSNMTNMFGDSAKNLNLSGWDFSLIPNGNSGFSWVWSNVSNYRGKFESINISNAKFGNISNIENAFRDMTNLKSIDISGINIDKLTNTSSMFSGCSKLETIFCDKSWNTNSITNSDNMFNGCEKIIGGNGTTFDSSKLDKTYAQIDGGTSNPGYFTAK